MGKSLIYIGNSDSDGMPNTMLEAIFMGAFPVQSNPGGVTAELIQHGVNGLLIEDCEDVGQMVFVIKSSLIQNYTLAQNENSKIAETLTYDIIKDEVLQVYQQLK